jgi:hypothetical protein
VLISIPRKGFHNDEHNVSAEIDRGVANKSLRIGLMSPDTSAGCGLTSASSLLCTRPVAATPPLTGPKRSINVKEGMLLRPLLLIFSLSFWIPHAPLLEFLVAMFALLRAGCNSRSIQSELVITQTLHAISKVL